MTKQQQLLRHRAEQLKAETDQFRSDWKFEPDYRWHSLMGELAAVVEQLLNVLHAQEGQAEAAEAMLKAADASQLLRQERDDARVVSAYRKGVIETLEQDVVLLTGRASHAEATLARLQAGGYVQHLSGCSMLRGRLRLDGKGQWEQVLCTCGLAVLTEEQP